MKDQRGQALVEFAMVLPLLLLTTLGVVEVGNMLLDQHIVTKVSREGSNLTSRDTSIQDALTALRSMSIRPVDFDNGSRVIFSVIKKGATAGTANFDRDILYQRYAFGNLAGVSSRLTTRGGGAYRGAPNYEAINSDTDANLQIVNMPANLVLVRGGLVYVTEVFSTHRLLTPLDRWGVRVPDRLYSIAYF